MEPPQPQDIDREPSGEGVPPPPAGPPRRITARSPVVVVLAAGALLVSILVGAGLGLRPPKDRIAPGVTLWGIEVGGRTAQEARSILSDRLLPVLDREVRLADGARTWPVTPRQLGCDYDVQGMVRAALAVGRQGTILRQVREGWAARRHGVPLKPHARFDREMLRGRLRRVARAADDPARDARIWLGAGGFEIAPEQVGRVVDVRATETNIVRYFAPLSHREIKLAMKEDLPGITAAQLRQIDGVLGTFTTRYNSGDANRTQNLSLAAHALHGTVVPAGDVFSYNDTVGPRTQARGYRVAKIFRKGEILDGIGGGICQVATTLYNAALQGRMRILERGRHSRPVVYAPPGRDATVSFGGVDFRFRNTSRAPILIQTRVGGGVLVVSIFGKRSMRGAGHPAGASARGTARALVVKAG